MATAPSCTCVCMCRSSWVGRRHAAPHMRPPRSMFAWWAASLHCIWRVYIWLAMLPILQVLRQMYTLTGGKLPIIGVGGVASGEDAYAKIKAGTPATCCFRRMLWMRCCQWEAMLRASPALPSALWWLRAAGHLFGRCAHVPPLCATAAVAPQAFAHASCHALALRCPEGSVNAPPLPAGASLVELFSCTCFCRHQIPLFFKLLPTRTLTCLQAPPWWSSTLPLRTRAKHSAFFVLVGASLVELYSAFAYEGPKLVPRVKRELAALLEKDGYSSVAEAVGADHRAAAKAK